MAVPYEPAEFKKEAFNCPYCQAYAKEGANKFLI